MWISKDRALCKACAGSCFRCHEKAAFIHDNGQRVCRKCSPRFRLLTPLQRTSAVRKSSSSRISCGMRNCSLRGCRYLTSWRLSDGLENFPTRRCADAGYFVTRRIQLHSCSLSGSGPFLCPVTSGRTSCSEIPGCRHRGHTAFHHPHWKLYASTVQKYWSSWYCKAHATWLVNFAHVLEHLLRHGTLPL